MGTLLFNKRDGVVAPSLAYRGGAYECHRMVRWFLNCGSKRTLFMWYVMVGICLAAAVPSWAQMSGGAPATLSLPVNNATNIQWFKDGVAILGANSMQYQALVTGVFYATYDDQNGCGSSRTQTIMLTPEGTITVTQATCATNGGANSDAQLVLSTYSGGPTKVGFSVGSSYTGAAYASATALTAAPMTLSSTLPNPTVDQPYTVRLFKDATVYKDYVVTLSPKLCLTADLNLSVSSPTISASKGELVTYTYTLNNAGPDAAPGVTAAIVLPKNVKFVVAKTSQGTYDAASAIWNVGTVTVGSQTITLTVEVK